jgi:protein involved in polysaccharide export with SLBB domain
MPVSPDLYILGPGDGLTITLWGEYDEVYELTVSAEGKISLPTIGELRVLGVTLTQAQALLHAEVVKYYRNVKSGISLTELRVFKVSILGAVKNPGIYEGTADGRVSDVIDKAGGVLPGGSMRHIEVRKSERVRANADLSAFLRRGMESANPYLRDGDIIFVPPVSGSMIKIFDEGAKTEDETAVKPVRLPTKYELEADQKFSSLVYDLGGLNPIWDLGNAYIIRKTEDYKNTLKINVDMVAVLIRKDSTKDIVLQNGDMVYFAVDTRWPYLNGHGDFTGIQK